MTNAIMIIAILLCVLLSGFFSASEISLSAANRVRLEHQAENNDKTAKRTLSVLERFDRALSAILVGNNLVNIASSSLGTLLAISLLGESKVWIVTVIITILVIICGETIPKITAEKNATQVARAVSLPVRFFMTIFFPVTAVVVFLTTLLTGWMKGEKKDEEEMAVEELHSMIETAEDEEILDEEESELVRSAIDFSETMAQEVMTARVDLVAIDINDKEEGIRRVLEDLSYSRVPVYEDSIDHVIGVLTVNHLLKAMTEPEEVELESLLLPVTYVYKTMKLPQVLGELKESRQHLAIVTDEYGGTLGIVTMEDVMEEIVGDIWDETDVVEPEIEEIANDAFEVDGDMILDDLFEAMDWDVSENEFESDTVGGWCIEMLEEFPEAGAQFRYQDADITVEAVEELRVRKIKVMRT